MKQIVTTLNLPEGNFYGQVKVYENSDIFALREIYTTWRNLCVQLENIGARKINLPEGLSESAFCLAKGLIKLNGSIPGANASFDCYDPNGGLGRNRIVVKACSVIPDLTSFGPNTKWDRIFFVDFYRYGFWDGTFDIYELNSENIYNFPVNSSQSLRDQQHEGRRPRFSIYSNLINNGLYISKETFNLFG
jgi:hypothetical protein